MDLNMPIMDGFQAVEELRRTYYKQEMVIIAVSAITEAQFKTSPSHHLFDMYCKN